MDHMPAYVSVVFLITTFITAGIFLYAVLKTGLKSTPFDQPNRGILYFPFSWLPTIVVPIVFFCHFASLYKLAMGRTS